VPPGLVRFSGEHITVSIMKHSLINRVQLAVHRRRSPFWFVSFPKSGRTWTKSVVENYVSRLYELPEFTFEEFTPWVKQGPWRRVPRLTFIHPHCRDTDDKNTRDFIQKLSQKKVIVMVRDPRNVVFTYYFRLRKRMKDPEALSMPFASFVRDEKLGITRIIDFTNTWYKTSECFRESLYLRFEDVQTDPIQEISRFLRFLDLPVDQNLLSLIIRETPDTTTQKIEDPSVSVSDADVKFMNHAMKRLIPNIGYQVDGK
jgi:hypothetical protein